MSGREYGRLGIYGGTFDPVHAGHIRAAERFYDELGLDTLLIMPALIPPHKDSDAESAESRIEMLKIAFEDGTRDIRVSDYEISRGGTSYTYLTLEHFAPLCEMLYLLCGTDMFLTLESWRRPDVIFRLCTPVLVRRENEAPETDISHAMTEYHEKYGRECLSLGGKAFEVSSTSVRRSLLESGDAPGLIPEKIGEYIRAKGLYHVTDRLVSGCDLIRSEAGLHHDEKRLGHVFGVEREIRRLSGIYDIGAYDTELCAIAALLHDVTKKESVAWHTEYLRSHGTEPDEDTVLSPKTFHQLTGSIMAKELYPRLVNSKVARAISLHTTGSPDMTLFDKLLFLADFIEDTRTFGSCVELREFFEKTLSSTDRETALDRTMLRAYCIMLSELIDEKKHIHRKTVAAYNAALKGEQNG